MNTSTELPLPAFSLPALPELPQEAYEAKTFPTVMPKLPAEFKHLMVGPHHESNWLIKDRILMSAYPSDKKPEVARNKMEQILNAGIRTFVCLQTQNELKRFVPYNSVAMELLDNVEKQKLQFINFEIEDHHIAEHAKVDKFTDELIDRFHKGEKMLIHCFGGHGRTGTICSIILGKLYKLQEEEVFRRVQAYHDCRSRVNAAPQTFPQFLQVKVILNKSYLDLESVAKQEQEMREKEAQAVFASMVMIQRGGGGATSSLAVPSTALQAYMQWKQQQEEELAKLVTGFAVEPSGQCPHIAHVNVEDLLTKTSGLFKHNGKCHGCEVQDENWWCLFCAGVYCSRYKNGHMSKHNKETKHPIALSLADLSFWCYECDNYVLSRDLTKLRNYVHLEKFGYIPESKI